MLNLISGILRFVLLEDRLQKLPSEVRGGANVARLDLHVVQILEPENVAFAGFRDHPVTAAPEVYEMGSSANECCSILRKVESSPVSKRA